MSYPTGIQNEAAVDLPEDQFGGLLALLEQLAQGDSTADILACECGEPEWSGNHGLSDTHEYAPEYPDAAQAVTDYGLEDAQDLSDALNTVTLDISVIRRGTLFDAGDIQSVNLVLGTGGPHDQINMSSDGSAEHEHVEWFRGEGTFERYVGTYKALADYLYDLAEQSANQR